MWVYGKFRGADDTCHPERSRGMGVSPRTLRCAEPSLGSLGVGCSAVAVLSGPAAAALRGLLVPRSLLAARIRKALPAPGCRFAPSSEQCADNTIQQVRSFFASCLAGTGPWPNYYWPSHAGRCGVRIPWGMAALVLPSILLGVILIGVSAAALWRAPTSYRHNWVAVFPWVMMGSCFAFIIGQLMATYTTWVR